MVVEISEPINSLIYGFGAFIGSFILLSVLWSMFLKLAESFFSKSKLYYIPRILKEVNKSIFLAVLLISIYFGVVFYDNALTDSALMKVWGVIFIVVVTEVVVKLILNVLDHYYIKSRKSPTFFSNAIPLMKRLVGVALYVIALILVINYLNYEVGSIVAWIGLLIVIFLFILYYDQLKNVVAGVQMIGSNIREGDYIKVAGSRGFVEKILEQTIVMRDMDGKTLMIPNSVFMNEVVKDNYFSEGNLISVSVELDEKSVEKAKSRLSAACSKSALNVEGIVKDYKPKVFVSGIHESLIELNVKFIVVPNADLRKILDVFATAIKKEFKEKTIKVQLD